MQIHVMFENNFHLGQILDRSNIIEFFNFINYGHGFIVPSHCFFFQSSNFTLQKNFEIVFAVLCFCFHRTRDINLILTSILANEIVSFRFSRKIFLKGKLTLTESSTKFKKPCTS